jgi:hypothetical protein
MTVLVRLTPVLERTERIWEIRRELDAMTRRTR